MRFTRPTTVLIATVAAAAALTGCNRGPADSAAGGDKKATLIMSTLNNPFFVSVADGAKAQAQKSGLTLNVQNANNSDQTALNLTTTALTNKPDVLIIDPVGTESGAAMVNQANTQKVPVTAFDRQPGRGDLANFIGYDAIQAGERAAAALAQSLGGKGKVVEIQGILGTNVAQDRSKGFEEGIKKFPGIQVVATQPADFDRGKALDVMTNVLQAHPDVQGVYAANDEMALGVVAALKARGLAGGKVKVVGNDGIADAVAAIKAGDMYATHAESPYALGQEVVKIATKVADGGQVQKEQKLEGRLVTAKDIPDYCSYLSGLGDTKGCPSA